MIIIEGILKGKKDVLQDRGYCRYALQCVSSQKYVFYLNQWMSFLISNYGLKNYGLERRIVNDFLGIKSKIVNLKSKIVNNFSIRQIVNRKSKIVNSFIVNNFSIRQIVNLKSKIVNSFMEAMFIPKKLWFMAQTNGGTFANLVASRTQTAGTLPYFGKTQTNDGTFANLVASLMQTAGTLPYFGKTQTYGETFANLVASSTQMGCLLPPKGQRSDKQRATLTLVGQTESMKKFKNNILFTI